MRKNRIRAFGIFFSILFIALTAAEGVCASDGLNVTQNWAAEAAFYSAPSEETETFRMTEEEFLEKKTELESRLVNAYSIFCRQVPEDCKEALQTAQKAWIDCYYAYIEALEQRWTEPVKIYFGITGKERKTNVYREYVLLMLINRITDLEEWAKGQLAKAETEYLALETERMEEARDQLQVDMGLCLYVIQEEYRQKIRAAHSSFFTFLESNTDFVSLLADGEESAVVSEEYLQIQKMSYLTQVYYQGCRFFRREREE